MAKTNPDESVRRLARREAREEGREYRPLTAKQADEAERLNRGLEILAGEDADEDIEADDD